MSRDFWEYDPATDTWIEKATFPGIGRLSAVAFSVLGKGYIGTGVDINSTVLNDFWEYDPLSDSWMQISSLTDTGRVFAAAFSIGNKGYVGTGQIDLDNYMNDFWEYDAGDCLVPEGLITINITSTSAKLKWDMGTGAIKYKIQYKIDSVGALWTTKIVKSSTAAVTVKNLLSNTSYKWKVKSICNGGQSGYSASQTFTTQLKLGQLTAGNKGVSVYPNPVSSLSIISFWVEKKSQTTIELFDIAGRKINTIFNSVAASGAHEIAIDNEQLSTGIYILRLSADEKISTIKVLIE